ncbi:hypothetical protein [Cupriavidus basilensis]
MERALRIAEGGILALSLVTAIGMNLLGNAVPGRLPLEASLAIVAMIMLGNGTVQLLRRWKPAPAARPLSRPLHYTVVAIALLLVYEGLASMYVAATWWRTELVASAHHLARQQDLAAAMRCERAGAGCWQAATANAGTAFGVALLPVMGPREALDNAQRQAALRRAVTLAQQEGRSDWMRALLDRDRACARSLLCTVTLGQSAPKALMLQQQVWDAIDLLAERTLRIAPVQESP